MSHEIIFPEWQQPCLNNTLKFWFKSEDFITSHSESFQIHSGLLNLLRLKRNKGGAIHFQRMQAYH